MFYHISFKKEDGFQRRKKKKETTETEQDKRSTCPFRLIGRVFDQQLRDIETPMPTHVFF